MLYSCCVFIRQDENNVDQITYVNVGCFPSGLGMLPVLSTRALSNFALTLSPDGSRVGNHRCSNLLDFDEVSTRHGFLTKATKSVEQVGESVPYQYNSTMRGLNTLRFYRNLNLDACLWEFVSYYDMSELLTDCGGSIGTDGQVSILTTFRSKTIKSQLRFSCSKATVIFQFKTIIHIVYNSSSTGN